jgi:DNA-binding transcriptional ArsR family regulator
MSAESAGVRVSRGKGRSVMLGAPAWSRSANVPKRSVQGIELLADATRRQLVALIAARIRHPSDLASALGLSRPAVSRQLRLLVEAGLLRWRGSTIDRRSRVYMIDPAMQEPILAWLAGVDLRRARPAIIVGWSPPMRPHRLKHDARQIVVDRDDFA